MAATRQEIGFDSEQLRQARELVLRYGWNATAYQIINPGIELWFSPICEAVVGFVRARNTLVVAGAPVCAPEGLADVGMGVEQAGPRDRERVCSFGGGRRLAGRSCRARAHDLALQRACPARRAAHPLK